MEPQRQRVGSSDMLKWLGVGGLEVEGTGSIEGLEQSHLTVAKHCSCPFDAV